MATDELELPDTLEGLEDLRQELTEDVQTIQTQLGDKQRTDETGRRLTSAEYWSWKKRAQHALTRKLADLRAVKAVIKEHRSALCRPGIQVPEPPSIEETLGHLKALHDIVATLQGDDVDLDQEERLKFTAAQDFLIRIGAINATAA